MPDTYFVNDSTRVVPESRHCRSDLGLPENAFGFCCFNSNWKILPDIFEIWMRLLRRVDKSVLWLLEDNAAVAANLRLEANSRGVSPDRLVFAKRVPMEDHLARHRFADIFLDTLPYNAHTTASEALWCGLPVVTCMGEAFAARVATSLLKAIGLPELITNSLDSYERLAFELATHPKRLAG
jgi:predicted O-linked N-acetylglucosamine transferase (SPINDLY family)